LIKLINLNPRKDRFAKYLRFHSYGGFYFNNG